MNPLATNHPISFFKGLVNAGTLDLTPSFQRRPVWSDAQASYLIDSLLSGLPIPEIYIRTKTDDNGDEVREVVDGQQRLRSMIRFFQNDLTLIGKDVSPVWRGTSWDSLSAQQRTEYWQYKVVVRELHAASDAEVIDMFRRLNANASTLNDQELRHSQFRGEFINAVEDLADNPWWLEKHIISHAQIRRMIDVEFIAELLAGLIGGPMEKKSELDDYFTDYDETLDPYWPELFEQTRERVVTITNGDFSGWRTKTEFYSLFLAIGMLTYEDAFPVKAEAVLRSRVRLAKFRASVDRIKKGTSAKAPPKAERYYEAVKRASTDRSRRATRIEIIQGVIKGR